MQKFHRSKIDSKSIQLLETRDKQSGSEEGI